MVIVVIGLTLLIAALFPFGGMLVQAMFGGMYGSLFGRGSPATYNLVTLLATYLPAALVAIGFVRFTRLVSRLPRPIPGTAAIVAGLALTVLFLLPRLYASTVEGGGAAMVVGLFGPYFLIPARILLSVGIAQVLLSAAPDAAPLSDSQ
jgi:hypothetical protein